MFYLPLLKCDSAVASTDLCNSSIVTNESLVFEFKLIPFFSSILQSLVLEFKLFLFQVLTKRAGCGGGAVRNGNEATKPVVVSSDVGSSFTEINGV
ncbi:hypothetical protein L2E82_44203 [Cichorium intybus]|uniref:Uncharacterized protein n=1 Tax=Cichorium intybus TaxID=13427 RepID=A0ACB8ZQ45_CICIN|nr:hypothetical protein L2E82_44203 [Cichorium intybus]